VPAPPSPEPSPPHPDGFAPTAAAGKLNLPTKP
jgi:hypothetical protein